MIRFAFRKGLRFVEEGRRTWTLLKRLVTGKIQLEDEQGEVRNVEMGELHQQWLDGKLTIDEASLSASSNVFYLATPRDLNTYDQRNQDLAKYRHDYLSRLANKPEGFVFTPKKLKPILAEIARELGHEKPPAVSTVYRWWCRYRVTKCVTKLTDGRLNAGRKKNDAAYTLFEECLYEVYLTEQKDQGKAVIEALENKVKRANHDLTEDRHIKMPSPATIYRWLKGLQQQLVQRARLGKKAAEKEFRAALKKLKVTRILERIEIDHTPLDLIIVDKTTWLPLGRPWLTLAIDRYSRMIMGFYISFHAPSSFSILQCLKRAILPKDKWLARFPDIKESWPARGIPEMIACDNGMDLHADAFEEICREMGIQILYTPAGHPYLKGAIERMFRTVNQGLIHHMPGTVFSNVHERGDYPSEDIACIDLETLTHLLTKWVVEVYHRTPHRGMGVSPLAKWAEAEQKTIIELPAYHQHLDVLVGIPTTRTLFHYGVEFDCLRYNSPELQLLRARVGGTPEVSLKCYEDDVGYIHVYDDVMKEYIRVPAVDAEYANGVSRYMHLLIRQYTKKKYGQEWTEAQIVESKREIQAIVTDALTDKKMGTRKKAAVIQMLDSEDVLNDEDALSRARQPASDTSQAPEMLDPGLDDELPDFGTSQRTGTED